VLFNLFIKNLFLCVKINIMYFAIYITCNIMALKGFSIYLDKTNKATDKFINSEEITQQY